MTRAAFTGTRRGMTAFQLSSLRAVLLSRSVTVLVHGACCGADDQADWVAASLGIARMVYPSTASTRVVDVVLKARVGSSIVIAAPAAPRTVIEEQRSGTWHVVRHARRRRHAIIYLWPVRGVVVHVRDP